MGICFFIYAKKEKCTWTCTGLPWSGKTIVGMFCFGCNNELTCVIGMVVQERQKPFWWCGSVNKSVCVSMLIERGQRWERPHQRFSSQVCVTLASLPELKEAAPDREHTDTTLYCAGIEKKKAKLRKLEVGGKWATSCVIERKQERKGNIFEPEMSWQRKNA